jgi:hypothetical protein
VPDDPSGGNSQVNVKLFTRPAKAAVEIWDVMLTQRPCSSVGQSTRLVNGRSSVRSRPGARSSARFRWPRHDHHPESSTLDDVALSDARDLAREIASTHPCLVGQRRCADRRKAGWPAETRSTPCSCPADLSAQTQGTRATLFESTFDRMIFFCRFAPDAVDGYRRAMADGGDQGPRLQARAALTS